jgi:hypothetical protein
MAEIPVSLVVKPFESEANWAQQRDEIGSWSQLPPIEVSSHFLQFWGVSAACPWVSTVDGELDFGKETAKSLRYLEDLRAKVYAE